MEVQLIAAIGGLIASILVLWVASDLAVKYSEPLSEELSITPLFVGTFILSVITSLPELAVGFISIYKGIPQISMGDIVGSNIIDMTLTLGLPAVFYQQVAIKEVDRGRLLFMIVLISLAIGWVLCVGQLTPWHGMGLVGGYAASVFMLSGQRGFIKHYDQEVCPVKVSMTNSMILFVLSVFGVIASSGVAVYCAEFMSHKLGYDLGVIGSAFFALGTSLPEIVINLSAVRRGHPDMALGNAIGSVLVKTTLILGLFSWFSPLTIDLSDFRVLVSFFPLAHGAVAYSIYKYREIKFEMGLVLTGICLLYFYIQFRLLHS